MGRIGYLIKAGWKKGRESWMIANPHRGGSRRKDEIIYLTLSHAVQLQNKWDAEDKVVRE